VVKGTVKEALYPNYDMLSFFLPTHDFFQDMSIAYFCCTRAFQQGMALLTFMVFLGLWPMHVFGVQDLLLYGEVNLL
jgi:hypothetical protein